MTRIWLATGNAHKVAEIAAILGPDVDLVARDPGGEETGSTFEANAVLKARALAEATGEPALADDSGIEIDHLGGAPGIRSARWTAEVDWVPRVLRELAGVPAGQRGCRYVCAAALVRPDGTFAVRRGVVDGVVAEAAVGTGGFGYDPIFVPVEGDGRTFAQMSDSEKHRLSHRGRAFVALWAAVVGDGS